MTPIRCCYHAPSTAGLFVQMSLRARNSPVYDPILDLLLPLRVPLTRAYSTQTTRARRFGTQRRPHNRPDGIDLRPNQVAPLLRQFSTTTAKKATSTLFNPQQDDDGNEMQLEITPRAAKRLSEIMAKDGNPNLALRIQVESGGCHGFQYIMRLVTLPSPLPEESSLAEDDPEAVVRQDDTIFAYAADASPQTGDSSAPKIILDGPSLDLLKGSKVDFTMELIGSQFKIVDNPLATSSCGCGTSFDIKI